MQSFRQRLVAGSHKLGLVLLGLLIAVVMAEVLLQSYGWIVRETRNDNRQVQDDEFVILTLGESTTAPDKNEDWPTQLEESLRQRFPNQKIKVINKGVVGTNTSVILGNFEEYAETYHPQIVITMMGINDLYISAPTQSEFIPNTLFLSTQAGSWVDQLKVVKLARLSARRTQRLMKKIRIRYLSTDAQKLIELGNQAHLEGNLRDAELYLERAAQLEPEDPTYKISLSWLYQDVFRIKEAEDLLLECVLMAPDDERGYVELANMYRREGREEEAQRLYLKAITLFPDSAWSHLEYGNLMNVMEEEMEAKNLYRRSFELDPLNNMPLIELANLLRGQGKTHMARAAYRRALLVDPHSERARLELATLMRTTKANEVTELATESATLADSSTEPDTEMDQYYHPETVKNYRKLLQAATKYQFDVVAVQYPVRPVAPLQELIEQVHQPRNSPIEVVVVDNSDVFHRALQTLPYDELFTDNFGGDFGHATREGNRLLSQNIEQAVLPLLPFAKGN